MSAGSKPLVGISTCLLGQQVRYDGAHKRHDWLVDELGPQVIWVPVCPEVELGLGVPREPIQLVPLAGRPPDSEVLRLIGAHSRRDLTEDMRAFAAARVEALAAERLSGYVFKTRSPSCGITRVKVYEYPGEDPPWEARGQGLFAAAFIARFPDLPVVEEHELDDPAVRASFTKRVRAAHARACMQ